MLSTKKNHGEDEYIKQLAILRITEEKIDVFVKDSETKISREEKNKLSELKHQLSNYITQVENRYREKNKADCDTDLVHSLTKALESCNEMLALPEDKEKAAVFQNASNNLKKFDPTFSKTAEIIVGLVFLTAAALVALWLIGGIAMTLFPQLISHVPTLVTSVCKVVAPVSPMANKGVALAVGVGGVGFGLIGHTLLSSGWGFFSNRGENILELAKQVDKAKEGLEKLSL